MDIADFTTSVHLDFGTKDGIYVAIYLIPPAGTKLPEISYWIIRLVDLIII